MLKVGGLWVSPVDMENELVAHEHVNAAGVVGITQDDASRIAAFVIREPGGPSDEELADELRAWCKERMRRYEYPHVVRVVDELPRTVNGKVQRFRFGKTTPRSPPSGRHERDVRSSPHRACPPRGWLISLPLAGRARSLAQDAGRYVPGGR